MQIGQRKFCNSGDSLSLDIRASERNFDYEMRQEIVFEFSNLPSNGTIEIEILLDASLVYKFNESYSESYLPIPVKKETRVLCWVYETPPGKIINLNTTTNRRTCSAGGENGNGYIVSANFTNTDLSLVITRAGKNADEESNILISMFHGYFHAFAEKFVGAERACVVSC